ncbi:unnamed protein product [Bursaphelenchus xylophilus]|uniref:(pine wood nematode) hypothetical protein n=1 Tax=Bursaphelenchus xylophilus TaxID=6326 RepID=A0A811KEH4_BURXY|nr:unnamed protein product [Bursaphelenchus xylophilus]CAG9094236.1 unnamed protein product [Bursaphelenchus xylophilus]
MLFTGIMVTLNTMTTPTILLASISALGIFGNANIAWATFQKKKLRSSCNVLITITAITDVLHQWAHLIWAFLYFNETVTTFEECFWIQSVPVFCSNFGSVMLLVLGLDRLICIGKPVFYEQMSKPGYIFALVSIGLTIPVAMSISAYTRMLLDPSKISPCVITGGLDPFGMALFFQVNASLNTSTFLVYGLIWIVVKKSNYSRSKQLLRTITTASLCGVGGWFFTMNLATVLNAVGIEVTPIIIIYNGAILNTSVTMNYLIYFGMSREYRIAFVQQLRILSCGLLKCSMFKVEDSNAFTVTMKSKSGTSKSEYSK